MIEDYFLIQMAQDCDPSGTTCTGQMWSVTPLGFLVCIFALLLVFLYLYVTWHKPGSKSGEQQ